MNATDLIEQIAGGRQGLEIPAFVQRFRIPEFFYPCKHASIPHVVPAEDRIVTFKIRAAGRIQEDADGIQIISVNVAVQVVVVILRF